MCESERDNTNGVVITRFYQKFGKVVADVEDGRITKVGYCQFGDGPELIGKLPDDFQSAW